MMQASVKQSNMHATASSGNSISQPTVQSMQFDVQLIFLLDVNSLGSCIVALEFEFELELDFDVDAPTFTPECDDDDDDDADGP